MKFKAVDLENVLRADADGMPIFRECFDHEVLMSFYDDAGCYAFQEFWESVGSGLFYTWLSTHSDWKFLADEEAI